MEDKALIASEIELEAHWTTDVNVFSIFGWTSQCSPEFRFLRVGELFLYVLSF